MITIIQLDKWLVPQLQEVLQMKMNKGDIQAELDLKDSEQAKYIRVDLKQLFIIIQALIQVPGIIGLKEIKQDNLLINNRQLFIVRKREDDWEIIKDLTYLGITQQDILIRDQLRVINREWDKE